MYNVLFGGVDGGCTGGVGCGILGKVLCKSAGANMDHKIASTLSNASAIVTLNTLGKVPSAVLLANSN